MIRIAQGERVGLTGSIGAVNRRTTKSGSRFAAGVLELDVGDRVRCVWWDADRAPRSRTRLAVTGEGMADGSLAVERTRVLETSDEHFEQRLLDYYAECIEAEHSAQDRLWIGSDSVLILFEGSAPLLNARTPLPRDRHAQRWIDRRKMAGSAESVRVGWPIVTDSSGAAAALLTAEATVAAGDGGDVVERRSPVIELNAAALSLLGFPSEDRLGLLDGFAALSLAAQDVDRVDQCVRFLQEEGLIDDGPLDPERLGPIDRGLSLHNTAIAYVSGTELSAITRALFDDLAGLQRQPVTALSTGPVGALLGHEAPGEPPDPEPSPAILSSTLDQECAIASGMSATLTVVTGPPGTGKSQVLVNMVAAALAAGESILLASKNNHALDVVVERIRQSHSEAAPVRLGRADFRAEAARRMARALSRPPVDDSGLARALHEWNEARGRIRAPYIERAERRRLASQTEQARDAWVRAMAGLPVGLRSLDTDVAPDLVVSAHQAAEREHREAEDTPTRWFWQRRRRRRRQAAADDAAQRVMALMGSGANAPLVAVLLEDGRQALLDLVGAVLRIDAERRLVESLQHEMDLMPDDSEIDLQIERSFDGRSAAARELFGAQWRERLRRRNAPGRPAATAYQAKLSAVAATGSGALRIRADAAAALQTFPVWAITNLAAGNALPLTSGLFDLVVIDEASQSDIPSALPLLYRAKRAVIVGDPQQLTHVTTLKPLLDKEIANRNGLSEQELAEYGYGATSLFALAASRIAESPIFLHRHFRSHPDIIGFANEAFYGGRLSIETDPGRFLPGPALRWIDVEGGFERNARGRSALNHLEAGRVVAELADMIGRGEVEGRTVGIASPFRAQVDLLRDLVARDHPTLAERITIDTAHGFQGDERDIMIFSPVVAPGMPPFLVRHAGDPNLVNVAVTRARLQLRVVGSYSACLDSPTVLSQLAAIATTSES
jgi:hypothetical protein